jgi:hypothetical protein
VPAGKIVHVVLDNYAAHKHPKVRAWLDRHERFGHTGIRQFSVIQLLLYAISVCTSLKVK